MSKYGVSPATTAGPCLITSINFLKKDLLPLWLVQGYLGGRGD
jgi:hypothetical protein